MDEDNKLQKLEDISIEDLSNLDNEELLFEFFKVKKLYNSVTDRAITLSNSIDRREYTPSSEELINHSKKMRVVCNKINVYHGRLIKAVGWIGTWKTVFPCQEPFLLKQCR